MSARTRRRLPMQVVAAAVLAMTPAAWAQAPAEKASAGAEAALSSAELDRLLAGLGHDSVEERKAAAASVTSLGADATTAITQKLADLRKGGDGGMGGGRPGGAGALGQGGRLRSRGCPRPAEAGQRDPARYCHLSPARSGARGDHAGRPPAGAPRVGRGGRLRPELTRQMKQMGDRAVAALIEARRDPANETRTWASNLLESMGKRTPGEAVQVKDNQALADVLRAYAGIKDLDALPVVLSFVSSDRAQVRAAARAATLAYGQDALWKLREAYAALMGEQAPEGITAEDLAKKLFDSYDRFRLQEVYALLSKGLAEQKDEKLPAAIADFDEALARQPMLDRRAEMVPAYVAYGESLEGKDRPAALATLRKALRLDEAGPQSSHVRSELAYLEGEDLLARGIADTEPFEQALAFDPQNAHARAELDRLHSETKTSETRGWRLGAAAVVFLVALGGIVVVGGRRKRRTTPA